MLECSGDPAAAGALLLETTHLDYALQQVRLGLQLKAAMFLFAKALQHVHTSSNVGQSGLKALVRKGCCSQQSPDLSSSEI
jgi:hypothetical protein